MPLEQIWEERIALRHVIDAYRGLQMGELFFGSNNHFELLAGQGYVREMILDGADADSIAARWSADVEAFKEMRKPYLLYPEN